MIFLFEQIKSHNQTKISQKDKLSSENERQESTVTSSDSEVVKKTNSHLGK